MTPDQEWASEPRAMSPQASSKVGGGERQYTGQGIGEITAWRCPSCGFEQVGEIAAGCSQCGSGSQRARRAPVEEPPPPVRVAILTPGADASFTLWTMTQQQHPEKVWLLLREAFGAGWQAAMLHLDKLHGTIRTTSIKDTVPNSPQITGAVARTLALALTDFRDQVLTDRPSEGLLSRAQATEIITWLTEQIGDEADAEEVE